jgi:type II secretory pathway component PulF
MHPALRTLIVFLWITGGIILFAGLEAGLHAIGIATGVIGILLLLLGNGWAVYAFLRYRQGLQDELAQVLTAAVNAGAPLASAVKSYANDRPGRGKFRMALEALAYVAFPLYGYVRLCAGTRRFNRLVEDLAVRLEAAQELSKALRLVPGVSSRAFRLAAAVGESTGSLGSCLRSASEERWTAAWLEIAPRIVYPFVILLFVGVLSIVVWVKIIPKFIRIFADFGEKLPSVTQAFVAAYSWIDEYSELVSLSFFLGMIALAAVIASPTVRWRIPLLGRLYRWTIQAEILRALGLLLGAGRTVPQALEILCSSKDLPFVVQRRLSLAVGAVERGDSLDSALERADLLPAMMGPLVRAAERARTLPWAVKELGDHLAGRAFRLMRRMSLVAAPLSIVAIGGLVVFTALTVFMPMIRLMWSLG